jgi:hypothetical protein
MSNDGDGVKAATYHSSYVELEVLRSCPEINCAFNVQICPKFGRSERENAQVYWSIPSIFE